MNTPPAEIPITPALVRKLLNAQHPDLDVLPLSYLSEGWDNVIYRLGDDYLIRLPRRAKAVPLLEREQAWLSRIAGRLPIPVPAPVRIGRPQGDYPWPWSITPWFEGRAAAVCPPNAEEAVRLAHFLRALHRPAPDDAPRNAFRARPLRERAPETEERLARYIAEGLLSDSIRQDWSAALRAHDAQLTPQLIHGDLHPKNIIVDAGRLSAIIDWGDLTAGDPATDLAAFWLLFDTPQAVRRGLDAYAPDTATRLRAKGWAIFFATLLMDIGRGGDLDFARVGSRAFAGLMCDR